MGNNKLRNCYSSANNNNNNNNNNNCKLNVSNSVKVERLGDVGVELGCKNNDKMEYLKSTLISRNRSRKVGEISVMDGFGGKELIKENLFTNWKGDVNMNSASSLLIYP